MIVKMKFLSITGPQSSIDHVMTDYLSKYEIQLEPAISELKTVENLLPFLDVNPYKDALAKATQLVDMLSDPYQDADATLAEPEILDLIRECNQKAIESDERRNALQKQLDNISARMKAIEPYIGLQLNLQALYQFQFIQFRFGRLPLESYKKLESYLMDDLNAVFLESSRDTEYVYGIYFVADREKLHADSVFSSMHFERIRVGESCNGTPADALCLLKKEYKELTEKLELHETETQNYFDQKAAKLIGAKERLEELNNNFDVRKLAARVKENQEDYFILCGWMAESDVEKFLYDIRHDHSIFVVVEEDSNQYFGDPPTKLKNPKVFKPFEMFIRMYGLPGHNEVDPTIFVALTYTFIFGAMFGDVGQGLLLLIGGALIYKWKKAPLAGIISLAGVFSTIFGFMFGSIFGFEDLIEPIWIRPIEHMTTLPFVGKLNTVFIVAIAFGMGVIVITMILHIINAIKAHDPGNAWFDANGFAGLLFYGSAIAVILLFMTGHSTPGVIILIIMFGVPLLLIALKEPLMNMINKKSEKSEEGIAMFLVQAFFELFETLLSYFSNTLSFVRIGAFAVSHAAMMEVVLMLAGAESGSPNWIVIVLGNLFVCGMEGLVVGIQVLRLEYYEIFSRFYKGAGREFVPYSKSKRTKKKH